MIVLARTEANGVVLHRVVDIQGERLTLMGDGNLVQRETCSVSDVVGIAEYIIRYDGRKQFIYTKRQLRIWRFWYWLCPVRKWLLRLM